MSKKGVIVRLIDLIDDHSEYLARKRKRVSKILDGVRLDEEMSTEEFNKSFEEIPEDWQEQWVEKAARACREDAQEVFRRILAGEIKSPGSYSKFCIDTIHKMSQQDAEAFNRLGQFVWTIHFDSGPVPFSILHEDGAFSLSRADYLIPRRAGLIDAEPFTGKILDMDDIHQITLIYQNVKLRISKRTGKAASLDLGKVVLSQTGAELYTLLDVTPNNTYLQFCIDLWSKDFTILDLDKT